MLVIASAAVVLVASSRPPRDPEPLLTASSVIGALPPPRLSPVEEPADKSLGAEDDDAGCAIPDEGQGHYGAPVELPLGTMIAPEPAPKERYHLLIHLHGGAAARKVVAPRNLDGLVIVTVDQGVGSKAYAEAFSSPEPLEKILAAVDQALAPAKLEHLVVSSWSAGYGGVRHILRQHPTSVSALVLLDSVHASYTPEGKPQAAGLEPFVAYARRAQAGEGILLWTHSDIRPPGYAATSEVADHILKEIGGRRSYGGLASHYGVELKTVYDEGSLHLRGFTGTGKSAHCAHVRMLGPILERDVMPALP